MGKTTLAAKGFRWFNGAFGNVSISPTLIAKLSAIASGDDIAFGDKVEPNIKIVGVTLISGALGASTTVTVKVGGSAITGAESTAAAVNKYIPVDDVVTQEGQEIILSVGGGAATGTVKVKLHYEVLGNL